MKKKLIASLLAITAAAFLVFGISACEAPHEHSFCEWTVVTAPTCTEEGTEQRECDCGEEETRTIAALGHDLVEHAAQEPTCTEPGWSAYQTCTRCDYTTYEELAATGRHNYESTVTTESTCTTDGVLTYTCTNCGDSYTEAITASGHDYESTVTAEATCTEEGVRTYTCANCGDSYTEVIPATGHNYTSRITSQPGCTTTGLRTYTCINCGDRYTQTIVATGHNYVGGVCTVCGYIHQHIITDNNGVEEIFDDSKIYIYSQYSNVLEVPGNIPPQLDCSEPYPAILTCPECKANLLVRVIGEHSLVQHEGKAPTCTEPGWEAYQTCENCDYTTYKEIPATGHSIFCSANRENETFDPEKSYNIHDYSTYSYDEDKLSCTNPTKGYFQCTKCNAQIEVDVVSPHKITRTDSTIEYYYYSPDDTYSYSGIADLQLDKTPEMCTDIISAETHCAECGIKLEIKVRGNVHVNYNNQNEIVYFDFTVSDTIDYYYFSDTIQIVANSPEFGCTEGQYPYGVFTCMGCGAPIVCTVISHRLETADGDWILPESTEVYDTENYKVYLNDTSLEGSGSVTDGYYYCAECGEKHTAKVVSNKAPEESGELETTE
ncbi:MAG TPA: hypothetical protein IAB90_02845 [Candidatus Coproplasma stercoripullorum]|uniref:C2H2-type domain-containing protein n=1 Tax=Candidatus Coproplasma stercoripullorum TaxID=2840751 RepID=A0A9D1AFD5_9FIRM|nr:hypothetical protein [Candidatus Coproplasma stercoripullorum]